MDIYDIVRHQQAQSMPQPSSQPGLIGQDPDRSQPMASVRQISMPGWLPSNHSRCSPLSVCKISHLAQVYNTHSQLSSGQDTGLAHTNMGNLVTVGPINTSPGIHESSGDSGSPIGTPLVLDKALCLAQTSLSSPLKLSPGKASGLADGINSLAACHPPATGIGDSMFIPGPNLDSVGIPQSYWDEVEEQFLDAEYDISCISKALNRLHQSEFGDIALVSLNMAVKDYPGSNTQVEMSPAQDVSCIKHLDSPSDVQQTGTAHADSSGEAVIVAGMSSPAEPQSTAITKPNSTGIVLTKGSVCVPCSPITLAASQSKNGEAQTLTQCGSSLDGSDNQVLELLSSSPTHCVDLDQTLVPIECKCALSHSCHMGFDPGGHYDCDSRKEYTSLLHQPFNTKLPKAIIPCCLVMVHMVPHQMWKTQSQGLCP